MNKENQKAYDKAYQMYNETLKLTTGLFKKRRAKRRLVNQLNQNIINNDSKFVKVFWERVKNHALEI